MIRILIILTFLFTFADCFANGYGMHLEDINKSKKSFFGFNQDNRIVDFVNKTVDTQEYTSYKLGGTHFDLHRGRYILDCSTYLDNILENACPNAYNTLVNSSGSEKPTSKEYFDFFNKLALSEKDHWERIDEVHELRPGDILVFRENKSIRAKKVKHHKRRFHSVTSGHVMVVMDKPEREANNFAVRVADSAPSGHSEDTREPHTSGIGIGTLLLKVDQAGEPYEYAWKIGSRWKRNVEIAMARPIE